MTLMKTLNFRKANQADTRHHQNSYTKLDFHYCLHISGQ